jgi:hypothetical protein
MRWLDTLMFVCDSYATYRGSENWRTINLCSVGDASANSLQMVGLNDGSETRVYTGFYSGSGLRPSLV